MAPPRYWPDLWCLWWQVRNPSALGSKLFSYHMHAPLCWRWLVCACAACVLWVRNTSRPREWCIRARGLERLKIASPACLHAVRRLSPRSHNDPQYASLARYWPPFGPDCSPEASPRAKPHKFTDVTHEQKNYPVAGSSAPLQPLALSVHPAEPSPALARGTYVRTSQTSVETA